MYSRADYLMQPRKGHPFQKEDLHEASQSHRVGGCPDGLGRRGPKLQPRTAIAVRIVIQPTEFQAFIQVSRPVCAVGQTIEIQYRASEAPYYAYILDIQGNNVTRLLPNRFESNNYITDTNWRTLPGVATYRLVCSPPLGPEYVQIIASTERIPQLETGTGDFPLLGTNPKLSGSKFSKRSKRLSLQRRSLRLSRTCR